MIEVRLHDLPFAVSSFVDAKINPLHVSRVERMPDGWLRVGVRDSLRRGRHGFARRDDNAVLVSALTALGFLPRFSRTLDA